MQRIIFATGLQGSAAEHGLMAHLLATGMARLDGQKLGIEVTENLAVVDHLGHSDHSIWALGPLVRGVFWECLAVPDIRIQARQIGNEIATYLGLASVTAS